MMRLYRELQDTAAWLRRYGVPMMAMAAVCTMLAASATWLAHIWDERQIAQERNELVAAPRVEWFTYERVEFVGVSEDGALRFESTRAIAVPLRMAFVDELWCQSDRGQMVPRSTESWPAAPKEPESLNTKEWTFSGDFPTDGRACQLRATITAERNGVVKTQFVTTETFVPID